MIETSLHPAVIGSVMVKRNTAVRYSAPTLPSHRNTHSLTQSVSLSVCHSGSQLPGWRSEKS